MGKIYRDLTIFGKKQTIPIKDALIDSGATHSFMRWDVAEKICGGKKDLDPISWDLKGRPIRDQDVPLADGETTIHAIGKCHFGTNLEGRIIGDDALVVDKLKVGFIIGAQTLQLGRFHLKFAPPGPKGESRDEIVLDKVEEPSIG